MIIYLVYLSENVHNRGSSHGTETACLLLSHFIYLNIHILLSPIKIISPETGRRLLHLSQTDVKPKHAAVNPMAAKWVLYSGYIFLFLFCLTFFVLILFTATLWIY